MELCQNGIHTEKQLKLNFVKFTFLHNDALEFNSLNSGGILIHVHHPISSIECHSCHTLNAILRTRMHFDLTFGVSKAEP